MIRWNYVAPRLGLLLLLCCLITWGLDPLLRWSFIRVGQQSIGARVSVRELSTALRSGVLRINGVAIANPQSPMSNLCETEDTVLQLDTRALLQRRFVVTDGQIRGIRFGTQRAESGALSRESVPPSRNNSSLFPGKLAPLGQDWIDDRSKELQEGLQQSLQSVPLAKDLADRWPKNYARIEGEVQEVAKQAEALIALAKQTTENPLRAIDQFQDLATQVDSLRKRSATVRENLSSIATQIRQDKEALQVAQQHDAAVLRQHVRLDAIDAESISRFLLGKELSHHVQTATQWISWYRRQFPAQGRSASAARGENIVFRGSPDAPDFLIRRATLQGTGEIAGKPASFLGEVTGLTTQFQRSGQPMTLHLAADGAVPAKLHAVRELADGQVKDRLVLDCPQFPLPSRQLGNKDQLSLVVSEGNAHIWSQIEITDQQMTGELRLKQHGVVVRTESVPVHLASMQTAIDEAVSGAQDIEVLVRLNGEIATPTVQVLSNLGPQVAQAIRGAAQEEIQRRTATLVDASQRQVHSQLADIEAKIIEDQKDLLTKLNLGDQQVRDLLANLADRAGLSRKYFSAEKIMDNILRR